MRILYIEPTSTELLSEHYETLLNEAASPGTTVKVKNLSGALRKQGTAPPLLPTFWGEGVFQLGEMFHLIRDAQGKFDAIIIGCSADPGLRLAKRLAGPMPVVAPFEAALHLAAGWQGRLAVFTPGPLAEVRWLEENAQSYGLSHHLAAIRRVPIHRPEGENLEVLAREAPRQAAEALLASFRASVENTLPSLIEQVIADTEADILYFSCTFWGGMLSSLARRFDMPIIDPLLASLKYTEAMIQARVMAREPTILVAHSPSIETVTT